jgi:hypothetical protein
MTDERSPAHLMAQKLLDLDIQPRPALWTDELEAMYAEALEASGLPEQLREAVGRAEAAEREVDQLRDFILARAMSADDYAAFRTIESYAARRVIGRQ